MLLTTQEAVLERPAGCLLGTDNISCRRYKEKERSAKGARAVVNNRNKKAGGTTVVLNSTEWANVQL